MYMYVHVYCTNLLVSSSLFPQLAASNGVSENEDSLDSSALCWTATFSPSET